MAEGVHLVALSCILVLSVLNVCNSQVLTPRSFNLAKGRPITASATCGVGTIEPELFCLLANSGDEKDKGQPNLILRQGQWCDYCDLDEDRSKSHPVEFAIDGTERWWQSPPLSRGDEFNKVDVTIDLGQEFYIAYIYIKMANSPRPLVWALEKSTDHGETWEPWQYFADSETSCQKYFKTSAGNIPRKDDQVLCVTGFSKIVPLYNGEMYVSLTNARPNHLNYSYADNLKEFMKATMVRLRMLKANTLYGDLMAVANQDPTVTRRYYYSIKDISIGGRCVCNGHADTCNFLDLERPNLLICDCQHHTVGDQCERCDAENGFVQKKWQPARHNIAFVCEPCQCYGRATGCVYDPEVDAQGLSIDIHGFYIGGGVCQNCGYNSTGINCEQCLPGYYRPVGTPLMDMYMCERCQCDFRFHIDECEEGTGRCLCREEFAGPDCDRCAVGYYDYPNCKLCDCHVNGTEGEICHVNGGQCPCKERFVGKRCDMCLQEFYNFPECSPCECDSIGSVDNYCKVETGQCNCEMNFGSQNCSACAHGFFNYSMCMLCECDPKGAVEEICDKSTGECMCKETFNGPQCDECARGYYGYPQCMPCQCMEPGSTSNVCQDQTGQCTCRSNYAGQNCERCAAGFYRYPDCVPCECDLSGSYGASCEETTGQCDCLPNFQGLMCDRCKEGLYNYPNCEECHCNPAGAIEVPGYPLGGCGERVPGRLCECKDNVIGRTCDACRPGYWNLHRHNVLGCEECACSDAGTVAGMNICNQFTGQCMCKVDVAGRNCDVCKDGFYGLHKTNLYGCVECNCDLGGSESRVCDKETGQCPCKPRVEGVHCDQPIRQHFIPTLDQLKYEVEDGYTPEGVPVRFGHDDRLFPGFSWKGYAILMKVQPEVRLDLEINKPSLYRLVYRYVNLNDKAVRGEITLDPADPNEISQTSTVLFESSRDPAFASVGNAGGLSDFVLNPGRWTISIRSEENVFLDYMFLIPQAYFEATVLQNLVYRPCTVPNDAGPCIHYTYPNVVDFPRVTGDSGYIIDGDDRLPVELFDDKNILEELNITSMAILSPNQNMFNLDLYIPRKDRYVLILNYFSMANGTQHLLFTVGDTKATAVMYRCQYSSLCRQVLLGLDEMAGVFELDEGIVNITVTGDKDINAGIESIVAIPYSVWSIGYIRPSIVCIRINGVCVGSRYSTPVGSTRIDFESLPNDHLIANVLPPGLEGTDIGLIQLNDTLNMIVLLGEARSPGPHKFVVHYYMPYHTGMDMPVVLFANGQEYRGRFSPRYCPGLKGCRGLIFFEETGQSGTVNLVDTSVKIIFNNTSDQQIWLDYLLLVPSSQYSPQDINLLPVDNSRNFIDTCLDDGYKIITPLSEFCEKSLFTLTTEFNNGALECECDIDGSLSFNCDSFGGQCQCRPNVIGRKCSACKIGHYGFPRCMPCNCPFGFCHEQTGACICPPRVTGDRCDVCKPETYGYDALIGCQECQCNPQGVVDGDLNCDENTGQCRCLPGIGGRKCDFCLSGFYAFPQCRECDCDRAGTTEDICDPRTAYCLCKDNVMGGRCDQCVDQSYNLDSANPAGCSNCFCFGNTVKCQESGLNWTTLMDMRDWGVTNTVDGEVRESGTTIAILDAEDKIVSTNTSMYWTAPDSYLGNKVTSYGGFLRYTIIFVLPRNESIMTDALYEPDVVLVGNNMTIVYRSAGQPLISAMTPMEVQLYEFNFEYPDTGRPVDRESFMMVLVNLQALHIRGSYYSVVHEIRLMEVELDVASETGTGDLATSVETCQCPPGYIGTSCEACAAGYFRARRFPYLGVCMPCACNGHADSCDVSTGECLGCRNKTMGFNCEHCLPGYYPDPEGGCSICGCPLTNETNNFADSCFVLPDVMSNKVLVGRCDCYEGYIGDKCERCAPGYYGNPMMVGDTCQRCECSGNINMRDPNSCDFQTGACLSCINNSTGTNCERCQDWWYGDAVVDKDCYPCDCDQCGSLTCHSRFGQCTCKPSVIGINCDSCAPDTWGFDSCNGCTSCGCAEASVSSQCNLYNGTCSCQPGVKGQRCDACISGYWNYMSTGCSKCECEFEGAVTCDPVDGQCVCLPGVTGDRCDTCLDRWVLIPQEGCQECDTCIDNLLDDLEVLDANITTVQDGLQTVSIGVEAMRRLDEANQTIADYRPRVYSVLYESQNISLGPVTEELNKVAFIVDSNILPRSRSLMDTVDGILSDAATLHTNGVAVERKAEISEKEASDAILYILDILRQINEGIKVTNIETYILMSEQIIAEIRMRNFSMQNDSAQEDLDMAMTKLETIRDLQSQPNSQMEDVNKGNTDLDTIKTRLFDLQEESQASESVSIRAMNLQSRLDNVTIPAIKMHDDEIMLAETMTIDTQQMSQELINSSLDSNAACNDEFRNLELIDSQMMQAKAAMKTFNSMYDDELDVASGFVNGSIEKADMLQEQASVLESVYTDTREVSSNALKAEGAYKNIEKAIDDARNASDTALLAAEEALMKSSGVGEDSKNMTQSSEYLLMKAKVSYNTTQITLQGRLTDAKAGTDGIENLNKEVKNSNMQFKERLQALPVGETSEKSNVVIANGNNSASQAEGSKAKVKTILDNLPSQLEKTIPLTTDAVNANRDINVANTQVNNVKKFIPDITTLLADLKGQSEKVQDLGKTVKSNVASLREKIAIARDKANLIRVGLNFLGNTSVTLRNPPNIATAGSFSKVSLFFKTDSSDGLLMYAGSARSGGSRPNQDYMALEIVNGNVVFKFDLGSGPAEINHPHYVADNTWYKVTAQRIGKDGTLTLERDPSKGAALGSVTGRSQGVATVLEMHPLTTKFLVGGIPDGFSISDKVTRDKYKGVMESVEFDDSPMGLWNFEKAENNYVGARERSILNTVSSNGFRFDGSGYVIISKTLAGWKPAVTSQVSMRIKTYAENGLLFFAGDGKRDFISVELEGGRVKYQFDLGGGRAEVTHPKLVNDGEWHDIQVNRYNKTGVVAVNRRTQGPVDAPGSLTQLAITDDISVGGYQDIILPISGITKQGFEGCIENLALQIGIWDLNENKQSKGVIPGCPEQIARVATFSDQKMSFVKQPIDKIGKTFDITFKMKTKQDEALLLYAGHTLEPIGFSVSMKGGKISVVSDPGGERQELMSRVNTYNDGRWHYISIMKMARKLIMNIDDYELLQSESNGTKNSVETETNLYFGNTDRDIPENMAASTQPLDGCIGDITVNGEFLNFAIVKERLRQGISLAGCPIPDPEGPYDREQAQFNFTTPVPTEVSTPAPGRCALEATAPADLDEADHRGLYFGTYPNSRIEYRSLPSSVRIKSAISMDFRTVYGMGVIFYFSDTKHVDHLSLSMKDGKIRYSFNSGTGRGIITSSKKYDDGKWHTLKMGRSLREGSMEIDGVTIGVTESEGRGRSINGRPPYYFGGLRDTEIPASGLKNLDGVTEEFKGCIANLKMNDIALGEPVAKDGTIPCSDLTESGAYFYNEGGYIQQLDTFKVNHDMRVSIQIRSRSLEGVIFSVHGSKGDFVVLQLVEGEMWFTADNGAGPFTSKYIPAMNNKLCDGMWHSISAVKNKNVVTLTIDNEDPITTTSSGSATSTDTNNPFYLGGNPDSITKGIRAQGKYTGCMRQLTINGDAQYLATGVAFEDVKLDSCPVA